ncbi:MAG: hypothetical protein AAGC83_02760 [Pseudomonadota bacterium]
MATTRQAWLGCSILACIALTGGAISFPSVSVAPETPVSVTTAKPIEAEMNILGGHLDRWIDDRDPVASRQAVELTSEIGRLLREDVVFREPAARKTTLSAVVSLQYGLRALTIQDRLILLAEQEVDRAQSPAAVGRLFRAHERREEIIALMVLPAVDLLETSAVITESPRQVAEI